jgi:Ser/Thr protein kinase RdoA (MazF antagonist)
MPILCLYFTTEFTLQRVRYSAGKRERTTLKRELRIHLGPLMSDRERFAADELAIVLSNFDIGVIQAIKEFSRGSRKAPKLLVTSEKGEYLLKRRARGKDDPFKVAFSHALQLYLASRQFPLPHLIGTRKDNNSMLQLGGLVYELFEYIRGTSYDNSLEATYDSGKILALYHKLLRDYTHQFEPPVGSYHDSRSIGNGLDQIPVTFNRLDKTRNISPDQVRATTGFLGEAYQQAAEKVNKTGLNEWPTQIVHCDWHPGNMLFRNRKVVAVIDYDAARLQQRVIDLANGVLQFSILGGTDDPATWPDYVDESRFKRFVRGYDEVDVISIAELQVVPGLMIEAMVAESVLPIAATGSFGRMEGYGFLQMIERKIRWVQEHEAQLIAAIAQ